MPAPLDAPVTPLPSRPRGWGRGQGRGLGRWPLARIGALALLASLAGCTKRGQTATHAPDEAVSYRDGPLLGAHEDLRDDPGASAAARVARLDRLLDLFDAARFGDDDGARESLWESLGGAARGRGEEATREAETRLLKDALALESAPGLDADARELVASAIQLLTADLHRPSVAEDLSIQTAAYRELIVSGHPRIADNARWRIYDHVRGCLAGAAAAPPARRPTIAVHSLYAAEDSIDAHLDDRAVHARPPLPAPASLWAMLDAERSALAAIERWTPVVTRRRDADEQLRGTALQALPAPRDPTWDVAPMPAGTGREESLAPIVKVDGDQAIIDLGRPAEARTPLGTGEAARALEAALAADGRGVVLFVAPPMLPSPILRGALQALLGARVATMELAIKEPRVPEGSGDVIVALPLEVLRATDQGPAAVILSKARVHVHLDGRGPRFAVDGRWLAARPVGERELGDLLGALDRAYPRERMITLSLAEDVLYQQLLDLLRVLLGGQGRRYDVVAWAVDREAAKIATPTPNDAEDRRLKVRADLWRPDAKATIAQPFPLPGDDQKRLESMARQLTRCIPEYESALPAKGLGLHLAFEEGRMAKLEVIGASKGKGKGKAQTREAAVIACAQEETRGFRLREQRDKVEIDVVLTLK